MTIQRIDVRIHSTAQVSDAAELGPGVRVWDQSQVREGARIGAGTILSKDVYIDAGVVIGEHCKIQNGISVYHGVTLEDGVFLGPHMVFTNDLRPRAINPDGSLKKATDWVLSETRIRRGASIGAGAVVTYDVPAHGLVYGNPARLHGFVSPAGHKMAVAAEDGATVTLRCSQTGFELQVPADDYARLIRDR